MVVQETRVANDSGAQRISPQSITTSIKTCILGPHHGTCNMQGTAGIYVTTGTFVAAVGWAFLAVCSVETAELRRFEYSQQQMGTTFRLVFYADEATAANSAAEAAFRRISDLNDIFSDYAEDSEARRLAGNPAAYDDTGVVVSDDLWKVLGLAERLSRQTAGGFDVTVGPLTKLWRRARRRRAIPAENLIERAKSAVDYRRLQRIPRTQSVRVLGTPPIRLDFGGIAKGYAADAALAVLQSHGIAHVLIDAGGDLRLGAAPPQREGWKVAVAAQRGKSDVTLVLSDCGVATSGDVWQYLEINGQRYSHIIDPRTGFGLTNRTAVTVIAPDGMTADALASAVSVLGIKHGPTLLESDFCQSLAAASHPKRGVAARIVAFDDHGRSPRKVLETEGFSALQKSGRLITTNE